MNALAGLDAVRARALGVVGPLAPSLLRDRERRIAVFGLVAIGSALALTRLVPMTLLAVGPIALGVPHLVADVRYLVARPGLHRRFDVWLFLLGPAALAFVFPHAWLSTLLVVSAALVARGRAVVRVGVGLAFGGLSLVAFVNEAVADLVLAHAHNAIAVGLFWTWSLRSGRRLHAHAVVAVFLVALALVLGGVLDGAPIEPSDDLVARLAPDGAGVLTTRVVLAYAFAQSVHYAIWLRLVPEADRPRAGLRSFTSSLHALEADLGRPAVLTALLVMAGLTVWAMAALYSARDGYLRLAAFHGPLELGAATLLLIERRRLGAENPTTRCGS